MQSGVHKLHSKFSGYWKEYERKDLYSVCKAICWSCNLKGSPIDAVKNNWGKVSDFLIQWEGYKSK